MKNIIYVILLILPFTLASCAGSPVAIALSSPSDIAKMSNDSLIHSWRSKRAKKFESEIIRRNLFSTKEWRLIKEYKISIGMRKYAVYASMGRMSRKSELITKNGKISVWHYNRRSVKILFGKNGKVKEIIKF